MRIYLAKVINTRTGTIEFESVFDSLEKSVNYLRSVDLTAISHANANTEDEESEDICEAYGFHILSKELNNTEEGIDLEYQFTYSGELLYAHNSATDEVYEVERSDFISTDADADAGKKFKKGDIVLVLGETYGGYKHSLDYIGIIAGVPVPKEEWSWPQEPWQNVYFIYYIEENGLIEHNHSKEKYIRAFNSKLPIEHEFLLILSKIIKGEIILTEAIKDKLFYEDKIFVKTVDYYKEYTIFMEGYR